MKIGKWKVQDISAVRQYVQNLQLIQSASDPEELYVSNAMLLDHIIDSIDGFLSDFDIDTLEFHLESVANEG